ncbi:MAG: choice-of-anchor B family protein [Phycisphaerae bacterium]
MYRKNARIAVAALTGVLVLGFLGVSSAAAQFTSDNVTLNAHLTLADLGAPVSGNGNDCWGYTSPSGRDYALMGVSDKLVVVEITNPAAPFIVGNVSHTNSLWADIKTFGNHAYVVNESGGGLDVVNLAGVDLGGVALVQRVTAAGLATTHNLAIDTDSGFLYLCLPNINARRLVAFDLADPANPVLAGMMTAANGGDGLHDAQIVTFTTGPNAGKQICFGASEGRGVDVIDVTDKANMFRISRTPYPNLAYCHQVWLSADRQFLYLNDELDGVNETVVFDVSVLANPVLVGSYNSGVAATDHNVYVRGGFIYEAEYHAGLRIFCAADPVHPLQVGWFDSFPLDDAAGFDGAWSVYPFFPSGTVIISDIDSGLFIVDPSAALSAGSMAFTYPTGRPEFANPAGGTAVRVEVAGSCGATPQPGTGLLHYDAGAGFVSVPMTEVSPNVYDAVFPAINCPAPVSYYVTVEGAGAVVFADPSAAPAATYSAIAALGRLFAVQDNFEVDLGWTTQNLGATSGDWQRGVPVDDPAWAYDPASDSDGSGQCFLTQNQLGNTDVDGGAVRLLSPVFDLTPPNRVIGYDYYLNLTDASGIDMLLVEINNNGGVGAWTEVARHETSGGLAWRHHEITEADLAAAGVVRTAAMVLRFTANDDNPQSIVESGVDAFTIFEYDCNVPVVCTKGDVNDDTLINGRDIGPFADTLISGGTPGTVAFCATDMDDNGTLDPVVDLAAFVNCLLGVSCP